MMKYFCGKFEHQLDDKKRIRIPARFRKILCGEHDEKTYCFAFGFKGCIYVLPEEELEETIGKIANEKMGDASVASMLFMESVCYADEDPQGRVVLPQSHREFAGITKDVVTIGRGKRLEIWSAEKHKEMVKDAVYDEEFVKLGI